MSDFGQQPLVFERFFVFSTVLAANSGDGRQEVIPRTLKYARNGLCGGKIQVAVGPPFGRLACSLRNV